MFTQPHPATASRPESFLRLTGLTVLLVVALLTLFLAGAAPALAAGGLVRVGPIDPVTHLPSWYQDSNGLALELNLDPIYGISDPPIAGNDFSQQTGFGSEAFFWGADASIPVAAGGALDRAGSADLGLALEAAYANEDPIDGDQIVFGRIRIRIDVPVAGQYVVRHPFGQETFIVAADDVGTRAINFTQDIGVDPGDFEAVFKSSIGPFLVAVNPPAPTGFVGDPGIDQTVTGSPIGRNFFQVQGPAGSNLGGAGVNTITTDLFAVHGKLSTKAPFNVTGSTYARSGGSGQVQVWGDSYVAPGIEPLFIDVSGGPSLPATPALMERDAAGNYFVAIPSTSETLPGAVTVTANRGQTNQSSLVVDLVDIVTITKAEYDFSAQTLTVQASSSDQGASPPALSLASGGVLTAGSITLTTVTVPPASVTVTSSAGGFHTESVSVINVVLPNSAPIAVDDTNIFAVQGVGEPIDVAANDVDVDGTLDLTSVTVTTPPAHGSTVVDEVTGVVTYTAAGDFIGPDSFQYTIKDNLGALSNPATVSIQVTPPGFTISGRVTTVSGLAVPGVTVTLGGAGTDAAITNGSGNYSFFVTDAGLYTVTPSQVGAAFTPASRDVTVVDADMPNQNFVRNDATISGQITGTGVGGVTVNLTGAATLSAVTAADGTYAFANLGPGAYTVAPAAQAGVTYTPASRNVTITNANVTGQNFDRTLVAFSISGTVTGTNVGGVTVNLTGAANASTVTAANGTYSFTNLGPGTYTVAPAAQAGVTYTPASRNVTITNANVTGQNFVRTLTLAIGGTIRTRAGGPMAGVTVILTGAQNRTTTSNANGQYVFNNVVNGSYLLTATSPGSTFNPTFRSLTISGSSRLGEDFRQR